MKKLLLIACLFSMGLLAQAQDYDTAIGIRAGSANGLTIKHFIKNDVALEGIISSRWQGLNLTGLYEIHAKAFNEPGFNWYYGFGAHLGFWDGDDAHWGDDDKNYTVLGLDGIVGLEYNISEIPINLSVDWKPALNLIGYTGLWGDGFALSVRYVF
ncbi:hypothetical protein [Ancylomarina sp. 16SWW S1-10-2]|uniref:hypothetical protein n=1 Tax=Ancylomarina sp. 16SWW S1-10-2 TaxID=2499681 RepID=UPI0012ADC84C|nr:hypothetical protein [Ancylomarina sp. 16SWW S1-10-2]MRT94587.1 hypothetical protein [Ancylomarina sp. 16SWW S1-10-2]